MTQVFIYVHTKKKKELTSPIHLKLYSSTAYNSEFVRLLPFKGAGDLIPTAVNLLTEAQIRIYGIKYVHFLSP